MYGLTLSIALIFGAGVAGVSSTISLFEEGLSTGISVISAEAGSSEDMTEAGEVTNRCYKDYLCVI
jgi:hypothetical protein